MSTHEPAPIPRLHVNIDHVATVRQARRETFPDPVEWALRCEAAGATASPATSARIGGTSRTPTSTGCRRQ